MSFIEKMRQAAAAFEVARAEDPWRKPLEKALEGMEAMSTAALLDVVRARPTTQNARRLAVIMRELKFVPIQSRRLMPGGYRDTVTRGWARPVRSLPVSKKVKPQQGTATPHSNLATPGQDDVV
jgi:hypothetical protein